MSTNGMLFFSQQYQQYLSGILCGDPRSTRFNNRAAKVYSELIKLFNSKVDINDESDPRILKAKEFIDFLFVWENECTNPKQFFSDKLWFDLKSQFPKASIKPIAINQDMVENIFCQVRGLNAQNDHLNYHLYMNILNTINTTQTVIRKKSNSGGNQVLSELNIPNLHHFKKRKIVTSTKTM